MRQFFWKLPHPFIFNAASVVVPSVLTFVIIFLLSPFDFGNLSLQNRLIQALISASIVSACIGMTVLGMKRFFPIWSKAESWTIQKEITLFVVVVFLIALCHFGLLVFQYSSEAPIILFQQVVLRTVAISIFPIIGLVFFEQYNHRTKQFKRALALNKAIRGFYMQKENETSTLKREEDMVWFLGENGKPVCQLDPKKIQFIKSDGNYIEIYHLNDSQELKKQLIRNMLSEVEKSLSQAYFWRVHKSFIANLHQVESVIGNARDLELVMKRSGERVPVSRTKARSLLYEITDIAHLSQIPPDYPIKEFNK
ncbi:LytTR family DNA-binding domain-containing protein [Cytophagales bacterium LB-30]|uniref:LytTR family DNA-binding domain-containing protein n=1 Tax=Shiella aurantiaca TaxID=3058365 RepID=A0ABT8F954_9BACT|nr:LytTR family DNA-binding domain-containing protein [Shiella aurantiaca]MDN4166980.1 LytTR family DNA-binding domain-containing protein [Shiella aurantiaca]